MTREEDIKWLIQDVWEDYRNKGYEAFEKVAIKLINWADKHPKNPWVMDKMPEINDNDWSDPVLLHVDGQFLKISRYCRRKDGTTYWNGVEDWNGEEVDAWMPIPELPKGCKG